MPVDEMSISAAETVAGVLQSSGRAQVVGERTPGQLLWGEGFFLDGGFVLVVPTGRVLLSDGTEVEGAGIIPDERVSLNPRDLIAGRDTQLEAALQVLYGLERSHR